jgi:hypothetical protein
MARLQTVEPLRDLRELEVGDIVRGKGTGHAYVVIEHQGDQVVAVRAVTITSPHEWERVTWR